MFGGSAAHWLSILELLLPPLDQFSGLAQILYLVAFSFRYSAGQGVRGLGRSTYGLSQRSKATLTKPSALASSLEMRLVLSLCENTLSCASEAFLFRSYVLCHAFRASTRSLHGLHVDCRLLQRRCLFLQLLLLVRPNSWRIPCQRWPCLRKNQVRPVDGPGPFGPELVSL